MKRTMKLFALFAMMMAMFWGASSAMADTSAPGNVGPGQQSEGAAGGWSDNFDSYATGTNLHNVGGWKGWDNDPTFTAFTTDDEAASAPNSVDINFASDLVHEYSGYTSGQWVFSGKLFIPSSYTGQSYLIFLNTYADGGPNNWSTQIYFQDGMVVNADDTTQMLPYTTDNWLDWELTIDLDADTQDFMIDGAYLYQGRSWKDGASGGGAANIGAIDLFANGATTVYYDDLMLMPASPTAVQFDTMSATSNGSMTGALLALAGLSLIAGMAIISRRRAS
ncbi:MAG: hypothetical protein KDD73_14120 [Anaerolineales bacterium]|nr:hypothetical protein [Anaerolineales bacterium]MCB9126691.1 hypothetical protein [Ardenticatenales bacterium]MCB9171767.1 hypothetical protein [Ardenticatenales bacterium]